MRWFERFRRPDPETVRRNFISARQKNQGMTQQTRVAPGALNALFTDGRHVQIVQVGEMDVRGERLTVCDPCYLGSNMVSGMERTVTSGRYPVFAAVLDTAMTGRRVSAVKLKVADGLTVRHELALPLGFKMWQADDPAVFPGVSIETDLACIVDEVTELPFASYLNRYYDLHPGKDLIHDELLPLVERTGFAMWTIPGTDAQVPIFSAGLGQGLYNAYWGFDAENRLTELVFPMIYPEIFI